MRRSVDRSSERERLLLRQFCRACIIAIRGYDFQEGQVPTERSRWTIPVAGFRSSSWCWPSAAKCTWNSPSPSRWSISSPATSTPSRPGAVCHPKSWSTISNRRFCGAWPAAHRYSIRAISTSPATTALRSRSANYNTTPSQKPFGRTSSSSRLDTSDRGRFLEDRPRSRPAVAN